MTLEEIYDSQVAPLMEKIISVCKANGIPMIASFDLSDAVNPDFACTTFIAGGKDAADLPPAYEEFLREINARPVPFDAFTIDR